MAPKRSKSNINTEHHRLVGEILSGSAANTSSFLAIGPNFKIIQTSPCVCGSGGGGTPAGDDTEIQYNSGGTTFGASPNLTYSEATNDFTVTSGDIIAATGEITSEGDITSNTGNITTTVGSITSEGNITANAGNIRTATGDIISERDITAETGHIGATLGDIRTATGNIISEGDVISNTGNITATAGSIISEGNITSNVGNITATGGMISASSDITAGGDIIAGGNFVVSNDLYVGGEEGENKGTVFVHTIAGTSPLNIISPVNVTGSMKVIDGLYMNRSVISSSVIIPAGYNACMVGPIEVASGVTITVPAGSEFVVY
jgi:filamentous hemagglutinin